MCTGTLSLAYQKLMLRTSESLGVPQCRTGPRETEGETTLLSSMHDSGIDLLTVASRFTLAPCYFISSLIVVLGVLRLTRCSRCTYYISSISLTVTVPRYIFITFLAEAFYLLFSSCSFFTPAYYIPDVHR